MEQPVAESKVARHERIKGSANPWELLEEILAGADRGPGGLSREDLDVRTRWWGIYPQGDGQGVRGGGSDFFMVRIRIPGGRLTAPRMAAIGSLSRRFARGTADITVRQNIQLHWVRPQDLRPLFEGLAEAGLTTRGACGDDTRNITSCPVSDLMVPERAADRELLAGIDGALNGNPLFYNLPRKFKITFAGCPCGCTYPEINDVGILPVAHPVHGPGYAFRVGGGLATRPHLSRLLPRFFAPETVVPALVAIATLFRDRDELRQSRERARLKFLFLEHGWTADSFSAELERLMGQSLPDLAPVVPDSFVGRTGRDHLGLHAQRDGRLFAGLSVAQGVLDPDRIDRIVALSETYGTGDIRLTPQQNLVISGISPEQAADFVREAGSAGLSLAPGFDARTVSCTGKTFCRLALAETKELGASVASSLAGSFPKLSPVPYIHLSGCPNDCGQMRIADIGLSGIQGKNGDHGTEDGFELLLGGSMAGELTVNRRTGVKLLKDQVAPFLGRLLAFYESACHNGEDFRSFVERTGLDFLAVLDRGTPEELDLLAESLSRG
ncbi:MAG: nitrite/sulfite reductase [Nitrospirae bacterium]|nr:nitrite/sulfite reductase [Nitrospirota bacterium]